MEDKLSKIFELSVKVNLPITSFYYGKWIFNYKGKVPLGLLLKDLETKHEKQKVLEAKASKRWRDRNKDKFEESVKNWRANNAERYRAKSEQWRKENIDRVYGSIRKYRTKNKEYLLEVSRQKKIKNNLLPEDLV